MDGGGRGRRGRGPLVQHGALRVAIGADLFERRRIDPHSAARLALDERGPADLDLLHRVAAPWTSGARGPLLGASAPGAAVRTVDRPGEHHGEALRATEGCELCVAVLARVIASRRRPSAV